MKSAIETIRELHAVSQQHPAVIPFLGAILELDDKFSTLEKTKQDKPEIAAVNPNELTRGNLQAKLYKLLSTAGDNEQEVALKIFSLLKSLE